MHWILTGMLIVASAATAVYTGYLMRRLFTLEPGAPDAAPEHRGGPAEDETQPEPAAPEPATLPAASQESS